MTPASWLCVCINRAHLLVALQSLSYLNCVDVRDSLVMWSSPAIDCHSSRYRSVLVGIGALIAFPVVGLPLIVLPLLMWLGRERADGRQPGVVLKAVAEFTFKTYKDSHYWWEIFAICRRLAFVSLSLILFRVCFNCF
jgi:hypothetical protein